MKIRGVIAGVFALLAMWCAAPTANADCPPGWTTEFPATYSQGQDQAMVVFNGQLYVGGAFTSIGGITASRVARYDGRSWYPLGNGLNSTVTALAVYNDGTGPAVYAAGFFSASGAGAGSIPLSRVAKWNGTTWQPLTSSGTNGLNGNATSLAVFNNQLIVGGLFSQAGGTAVSNIAAWNGTTWTALADGLNAQVNALGTFTESGVTRLYAGGTFTQSGTTVLNLRSVARWNGTAWSTAGQGFTGTSVNVNAFAFYGGSVYAGGVFSGSGINSLSNIARFTGTQWVDVGGGVNNTVLSLGVFNDGTEKLFVGGSFTTAAAGTVSSARVIRWDGTNWLETYGGTNSNVLCFQPFNDGFGTKMFIGGAFTSVGITGDLMFANGICTWNGQYLSPGGKGPSELPTGAGTVGTGANAKLAVLGTFTRVGGLKTSGVALYDGTSWSTLGQDYFNSGPLTIIDFNGSTYVGGGFTGVGAATVNRFARWSGSAWEQVGSFNNTVSCSVIHNGLLYVGGLFTTPGNRVASYNGTAFTALGTGMNNVVNALASYNGQLIAAGSFTTAGGNNANRIAAWNGSTWTALGNGLNNQVRALAVYNGELFAAGDFTTAGVSSASRVARWNGSTWRDAGGGMDTTVLDLKVVTASGTQTLYAIGNFTSASGGAASRFARWNGCRWVPVGAGFDQDPVTTPTPANLASVNSGNAAGLYVTGNWVLAGNSISSNYLVHLSVCFDCPTDIDDGSNAGRADGGVTIDDLVYYLRLFEAGDPAGDFDDGSLTGACDGGVTIEDLVYFLVHFEAGC